MHILLNIISQCLISWNIYVLTLHILCHVHVRFKNGVHWTFTSNKHSLCGSVLQGFLDPKLISPIYMMWQKKAWLGDLHLLTFGTLTSTAMCFNRWYSLQNSTQPSADIPASYLWHVWIESQTWHSATGLFQNWTWARLMDGQRATKMPGSSMHLLWNKKKKERT